MASRLYETKGKPPAGMEPVDRWFFASHVTPLLPMSDFHRATNMAALEKEFLAKPGEWAR